MVHVGVMTEDTTTALASEGFVDTLVIGEVTNLGGEGLGGVVTMGGSTCR